ncbi:hypothetical protein NA56DRAFT_697043 [Hyaloscypha hepaticicola]|uniref:Uncharacterized protein n=1 Tax=Hyaloscypha hepaticicola TaxID=2082293 RepID=A0A2J6QP30_9HELO|nr:hypothetical protein NA56DRAFT_697043 [Hyaloscypha hepaticicola]
MAPENNLSHQLSCANLLPAEPSEKQYPRSWNDQISNKRRGVPRDKNKGRRGKGKKKEKEVATAPGGIRKEYKGPFQKLPLLQSMERDHQGGEERGEVGGRGSLCADGGDGLATLEIKALATLVSATTITMAPSKQPQNLISRPAWPTFRREAGPPEGDEKGQERQRQGRERGWDSRMRRGVRRPRRCRKRRSTWSRSGGRARG